MQRVAAGTIGASIGIRIPVSARENCGCGYRGPEQRLQTTRQFPSGQRAIRCRGRFLTSPAQRVIAGSFSREPESSDGRLTPPLAL